MVGKEEEEDGLGKAGKVAAREGGGAEVRQVRVFGERLSGGHVAPARQRPPQARFVVFGPSAAPIAAPRARSGDRGGSRSRSRSLHRAGGCTSPACPALWLRKRKGSAGPAGRRRRD